MYVCPYCMCASALFVPETSCVNPEMMLEAGEMVEKAAQARGPVKHGGTRGSPITLDNEGCRGKIDN